MARGLWTMDIFYFSHHAQCFNPHFLILLLKKKKLSFLKVYQKTNGGGTRGSEVWLGTEENER